MEYNILRDWLSNHQFTWEKLDYIEKVKEAFK